MIYGFNCLILDITIHYMCYTILEILYLKT